MAFDGSEAISQYPIEAYSLSAITALASELPDKADTPLAGPHPPLTLYIARVPGSRDVFLTPVKPRAKIVTAQDVQSSLYYVHIHMLEPDSISSVNTNAEHLLSRRPPKPPKLPQRRQDRHTTAYEAALPQWKVDNQHDSTTRQPDSGLNNSGHTSANGAHMRMPRINRKPVAAAPPNMPILPPRPLPPLPARMADDRVLSLHDENVRLLRHVEHGPETNPYERQYPESSIDQDSWTNDTAQVGSLTLIRRDPSSGQQWNVASIRDPLVGEVTSSGMPSSNATKRAKQSGTPLYLDVTNPAYAPFNDNQNSDFGNKITGASTPSEGAGDTYNEVFHRRLYMPGSVDADHIYTHTRSRSSISASSESDASTLKINRLPMNADRSSRPPALNHKIRNYTFASPWPNSRCDFTTGATGRSLKCRHTFRAFTTTNPPDTSQYRTVDVSELRFNLPAITPAPSTPSTIAEKRGSYLSTLHRRLQSSGSDHSHNNEANTPPAFVLDDDGNFDLTLGRERAGGGVGGKKAKLGKLIIEAEGFKMLDLLVAANVALWSRAYERS